MYRKVSIIISIILVTAAILTVQSSPSLSMLQSSYAQSCPDGSPVDASGNCPTDAPPPAGDGETAEAPPPADEEETAEAPPPAGDEQTAQAPPPATTETPPPVQAPPATTETPPPPAAQAPPPAGASQGSNNTNFVNTILEIINRERAAVGVPPLVWNNSLAAGAQAWADYEASLDRSFHSPGNFRDYAETIANSGPHNPIDVNATLIPMLNFWINEKANYVPGTPVEQDGGAPNYYWHYTQLVWRTTTEIGCGMATNSVNDFLVCRFLPMGNYIGQAPY
jgi:Cysteine-rich secretory protein family